MHLSLIPEIPRPAGSSVPVTAVDAPPDSVYTGPRRYQIRFPEHEAYVAAQAAEAPTTYRSAVSLPKRSVLAVELPTLVSGPMSALKNETSTLDYFVSEYGAQIIEDYQYAMDLTEIFAESIFASADQAQATLDEVTRMIQADRCWDETTGEEVVIAVVDTGIDGRHLEFPAGKRAGSWQESGDTPWTDGRGHGTMCAAIAAGTRAAGGAYNGVAPGARLIACKTKFFDTQLAAVYDYLIDQSEANGWNIVANNSFGIQSGVAPPPPGTVFMEALDDAIAAGIAVVFSAGNYHELTGGPLLGCSPTSIWQYKCRADLLTVATCRDDRTMWSYSSRGPGKHAGGANAGDKPDVTAPTPVNGAVLYGDRMQVLPNGWGTSGAAPQAAGLAALLWSRNPGLTSQEIFEIIRRSAAPLGHGPSCEGRGLIQCLDALNLIP